MRVKRAFGDYAHPYLSRGAGWICVMLVGGGLSSGSDGRSLKCDGWGG